MSIHKRIRDGRLKLGLTEQAFADRIGVTRGSVQQWEKEGGTAPSRKHQPAVARELGLSVAELMHGTLSAALPAVTGGGAGGPSAVQALSNETTQLGLLFDRLPDDVVLRAKAWNAASSVILELLTRALDAGSHSIQPTLAPSATAAHRTPRA